MFRSEGHELPARAAKPLAGPFRQRSTVLAARVRDGIILLDRERELYLTLNEVAADIWERLAAGVSPLSIVDSICTDYEAPREQVAADVAAQVDELLRGGLLEPGAVRQTPDSTAAVHPPLTVLTDIVDLPLSLLTSAAHARLQLPSYLQCALVITGVKLRLGIRGYDRTLGWIRRGVNGIAVTAQASMEAVCAAEYRLALTAALYPARAKCLEQSLALYYLLRRQGVAVRYCQGVQPHPFEAHAWVEYQGAIVNDVPERVKQFVRLPEQLP